MAETNLIAKNLQSIQNQILQTCQKYNRDFEKVKLVAVSKTKPASDIEKAFRLNQFDFAENYTNELVEKANNLKNFPITWHYIGQIQSNKTKLIAKHSNWIHSLSSIKVANRLNSHCLEFNKKINVLIQINLLNENQKSGVNPNEINDFAEKLLDLKNLILRGVMFIPPVDLNENQLELAFLKIVEINESLKQQFSLQNCDTLSFGMSSDWKLAIKTGSTCIRIGTAIFGQR